MEAALSLTAPEPPAEAADRPTVPLLSVVVPTKNERDNVAALVERLEAALPTVAMEIIFVDDSDDGTRELVAALAEDGHHELVLVPQGPQRRICGLGAAVLQGMRVARGSVGLRHRRGPSAPARADRRAARAGRVARAGHRRGEPLLRRRRRRRLRVDARDGLAVDHYRRAHDVPAPLRGVSDPMSGFFLVRARRSTSTRCGRAASRSCSRSSSATRACARPRCRSPSASGGPAAARRRSARDALPVAARAASVRAVRDRGALRPCRQHAAARVLHRRGRALLRRLGGDRHEGSTLWNFCFTELWVFSGRDHRRSRGTGLGMFFLMNKVALSCAARCSSCSRRGSGYATPSRTCLLLFLTVIRYGLADGWIWAKADPRTCEWGRTPTTSTASSRLITVLPRRSSASGSAA